MSIFEDDYLQATTDCSKFTAKGDKTCETPIESREKSNTIISLG